MIAYIILFICIGAIFLIPKQYFKKYGLVLLMVTFAIFFGIRDNLAVDDLNYIYIFSTFSKSLENVNVYYQNVEMIFKVICRIFGFIHLNYKAVFLLYSSLTFTFLGLFLKKLELSKKELSIFVMFFLGMAFFTYMTVMRQFLAIAIALYGMVLFSEKKYKPSIIWILVSVLFHNSTIVVLFILPIFMDKVKIDYRIKIAIPIFALILGETGIINDIIKLIAQNLKYGAYVLDEEGKAFAGSGITHYFYLAVYIIQCIMMKNKQESKNAFLEKGQFIYFTTFFATINSGYAIRVSYIFLIFLCLLFVTFIKEINTKKLKLLAEIFIYIILIVLIVKNIVSLQNSKFMSNNFSLDFFTENKIE